MKKDKIYILKTNTWRDLFTHIGLIITITVVIIMFVFMSYLPAITDHGETIIVPDLTGRKVENALKYLDERNIKYDTIADNFSVSHRKGTVLSQSPLPGEKVKVSRVIKLKYNPVDPPKVLLKPLLGLTFENAMKILKNKGMALGAIEYKPSIEDQNTIIGMFWKGSDLSKHKNGLKIKPGSKIKLVVADGIGQDTFPVPDLRQLPLDEVELILEGQDLTVGHITYVHNSDKELGTVIRQMPEPYIGILKKGVKAGSAQDARIRNQIRAGEIVDLWVVGNPAPAPEEEDEEAKRRREIEDSLWKYRNTRKESEIKKNYEKEKKEPSEN